MTIVLGTFFAVDQSRSPSEELVVHSNRLQMCFIEKLSHRGVNQLVFFYAQESLISYSVSACIMLVSYNVCFIEPLFLFDCSVYILGIHFP